MRSMLARCRACFWASAFLIYLPFKLGWYVWIYCLYQDGTGPILIQPAGRTEV